MSESEVKVPKRRGRPRKSPEEKDYKTCAVLLDRKDYELLQALAKKRVISATEVLRQALREVAAREGYFRN